MDELIQEIKLAFADTPYPSDNRIGTYDLNTSFGGLHWKEVPLELLFRHRVEITSFTPEAFRFFLPAMLLGVLLHHKELDALTQTLISSLTPSQAEDYAYSHWGKKFNRIVELLSANEKKAIYNFLLKYRELYLTEDWGYGEKGENDLERAIRYWATV